MKYQHLIRDYLSRNFRMDNADKITFAAMFLH